MSQLQLSVMSFLIRIQVGIWPINGISTGSIYGIQVNLEKLGPCDKKAIVFITGISVSKTEESINVFYEALI